MNRLVFVAAALFAYGLLAFPQAKKSQDLIFASAMDGGDGDIRAQTRKSILNLGAILKSRGVGLKDIVSVTVHLSDSRNFGGMEEIYRGYFKTNPPVRSVIEADIVPGKSLVQISAIAVASDLPRRIIYPARQPENSETSSYAIQAGDYVFLPGLIAPEGESDIKLQTRKVLDKAKTLVQNAGFVMSDLTSSRVWLADPRDFQAMNEIYRAYFTDIPPTRATLRGRLASPESRIQIMMWGMKGARQRLGTSVQVPLSQAIKVEPYLVISGIIPSNQAPRGKIREQTKDVLQQIAGLLKQAGMDFSDVVDAEVFLSDTRSLNPMIEVYREMVKDAPAHVTVEVLMSADMLVEIAMVATRRGH